MKLRSILTLALGIPLLVPAALLRLDVKSSAIADDPSFSRVGSYERLSGKAYFAVDPRLPANRMIRDLDKAPKNTDGLVEFSADVVIVRPRDAARGNGAVLFEVVNRGNAGSMWLFNRDVPKPAKEHEFGDCFLLEQGYTLVQLGWQFDVPRKDELLRAYLPVAKGINGIVRSEIIVSTPQTVQSLADRNHIAYPVANPDDPALTMTVRDSILGPRQTIPRSQWRIVDGASVEFPAGFVPGRIYEVVYTAQDPAVAGLGSAGIRDLISHLKHGKDSRLIQRAYGYGQSQSGRFLRNFVYEGYNADEQGRRVFDGLLVHIAGAGRGSFTQRFAQPSRDGSPYNNLLYPTDIYPFSDLPQQDPETGRTDGILAGATTPQLAPKIFYTNSSYEYYGRAASLIHTTLDGTKDAPIPATTRIYFFAGAQHGPARYPPRVNDTQFRPNPNPFTWSLRALLVAMDKWVRDGTEPPSSQYPRIDKGELVPLCDLRFPAIPGTRLPQRLQTAYRVDYGPEFLTRGIVSIEPPKVGRAFPTMVPQVDEDGNERTGIRLPSIQVPLATYTGWNLRAPSIGAPHEMSNLIGSYFPLPRTKAERESSGDPRPSIEERYPNRESYLEKVRAAANDLVERRYLLERDIAPLLRYADAEWEHVTTPQ